MGAAQEDAGIAGMQAARLELVGEVLRQRPIARLAVDDRADVQDP